MEIFFSRLEQLRGERSVSQFARMIGVRQQTLNNYMNGREPPASFVKTVCSQMRVSADWLLGLTDKDGSSVSATNSTVAAFGSTVTGGDCSRCPLMLAAREMAERNLKRKGGR